MSDATAPGSSSRTSFGPCSKSFSSSRRTRASPFSLDIKRSMLEANVFARPKLRPVRTSFTTAKKQKSAE